MTRNVKRLPLLLALLVGVSAFGVSAGRNTAQGAPGGSPTDIGFCESHGWQTVEDMPGDGQNVPSCTHGPDPVNGDQGDPVFAADPPGTPPNPPCFGDGSSGKRVEVIYGVPKDLTNRYATVVGAIRVAAAWADFNLDSSDLLTSQHLRFRCNDDQEMIVRNVKLRAVSASALASDPWPCAPEPCFSFWDMRYSLRNQVSLGLGSTNYTATDRIYVTFVDGIDPYYGACGQGEIDYDDSSGLTNNNNTGPAYSLISDGCWTGSTTLHELGHNLGAVQLSAPRTSGAAHCYDEFDVMCYNDNGPYFRNGGTIQYNCPVPDDDRKFDCGKNDYYNVNPAPNSYLDRHWNTVQSGFLTNPQ